MIPQEAALKEAVTELRRLLAYNMSSQCTDERIGDTALVCKRLNRKSTPRRGGHSTEEHSIVWKSTPRKSTPGKDIGRKSYWGNCYVSASKLPEGALLRA